MISKYAINLEVTVDSSRQDGVEITATVIVPVPAAGQEADQAKKFSELVTWVDLRDTTVEGSKGVFAGTVERVVNQAVRECLHLDE